MAHCPDHSDITRCVTKNKVEIEELKRDRTCSEGEHTRMWDAIDKRAKRQGVDSGFIEVRSELKKKMSYTVFSLAMIFIVGFLGWTGVKLVEVGTMASVTAQALQHVSKQCSDLRFDTTQSQKDIVNGLRELQRGLSQHKDKPISKAHLPDGDGQ